MFKKNVYPFRRVVAKRTGAFIFMFLVPGAELPHWGLPPRGRTRPMILPLFVKVVTHGGLLRPEPVLV